MAKEKKRGKKSQISAFILLGLVILSIFLFMFYIRGQIQASKVEKKIDVIAEILQKTPALDYYVTLCLKDSVESALLLTGKQGGNIYLEQGGIIDRSSVPIFKYKDDNITYGLTSADTKVENAAAIIGGINYPPQPGYPCMQIVPPVSYICPHDFLMPVKFFPFSRSHLPLLCITGGPNDIDVGIYPFPCPSGSYGQNSIQEQIKVYAQKRMKNCTNFSAIRQTINYDITAGSPDIMPIMGENNIIVKATYPVNITVETYGSVRLLDFEVNIPVRLKKIYGVARFLADYDKNYLDFNATRDFDSELYFTGHWDEYMRVEKFCPKCSLAGNEKDTTDILQINDSKSNIMGNDYYFRFAVENRIPALDWIRKTDPGEGFDYIVQEGDEIIIEPMGYDPDDSDDLYYRYEGWKQTYDEVFDPGCCKEIRSDAVVLCQENPWPCVKKAPAASLQLCMDDFNQKDLDTWTTSRLHIIPDPIDPSNKYRSANYATKTTDPEKISANPASEELNPVYYNCFKDENNDWLGTPYSRDLGPHNVTVKVCDRHEKCDWQNVLIMVTDIPRPVIEVVNDYGTTEASLEDPFTLDASKSNIFAVVDSYTWKTVLAGAATADFEFTVPYAETDFGRIKVPHPFQSYDITNIKGAGNFFRNAGVHTLSLTIGSQTETKEIEVKKCIPYSSTDPPYPYNTGSNPFMASHSCCEPGGIYSDSTKKCYEDGEYGSMIYLDDAKYTVNDPTLSPYPTYWYLDSTPTQTPPSITGQYSNDIFHRKFERSCSGDRGNICSGYARETRVIAEYCSDLEYEWQDERCQGPTPGVFESGSEAYCIDYPTGEYPTFEVASGIGTPTGPANGYCSDTSKCTDAVDYRNNGKYLCQKAMCENGICRKPRIELCQCNSACNSAAQCDGISFTELNNPEEGICQASGFCGNNCQFYLPDTSIKACEVCSSSIWISAAGSPEIDVKGNCCGDNDGYEGSENEHYITGNDGTSACCDNKDASGIFFGAGAVECVYDGMCTDTKVELEICDGIDNDCDGAPDNNLNLPLCGSFGICAVSTKKCVMGTIVDCNPSNTPGYEYSEITCNDGIDNDCDGWTDCVPGNEDDNCNC